MTTQRFNIIQSIEVALSHSAALNEVIARNVSRANLPRAKAETLKKLDFKEVMLQVESVNLHMTNDKHLKGKVMPPRFKKIADRDANEITPVGNNIVLPDQLGAASKNNIKYQEFLRAYAKFTDIQEEVAE